MYTLRFPFTLPPGREIAVAETPGELDGLEYRLSKQDRLYVLSLSGFSSMAIETLATEVQRTRLVLDLLEKWKQEADETLKTVAPDSDDAASLQAVRRELLFRREGSIRRQVRNVIFTTLTGSTRHAGLAGKPGRDYLESMSEQTVQLLDAFDALPSDDKQTFVVEIMRRARELPFDSGPIADEEIGEAGKAVFALLDQEENAAHTR
jgi:hypothetical protein